MTVHTDRSDPVFRHRRYGDLAGVVGAVAMAKRTLQACPDTGNVTTVDQVK